MRASRACCLSLLSLLLAASCTVEKQKPDSFERALNNVVEKKAYNGGTSVEPENEFDAKDTSAGQLLPSAEPVQ